MTENREKIPPPSRPVTLDGLLGGSARQIDRAGFHAFLKDGEFRRKLLGAFGSVFDDPEGVDILRAFRTVLEKRLTQPWTPEHDGGIGLSFIIALSKCDDNGAGRTRIDPRIPRKELDDNFGKVLRIAFNEICNSYIFYSKAVIDHWGFMRRIDGMGKDKDSVAQEELATVLKEALAQYVNRNA